jgi:hypothetical protein
MRILFGALCGAGSSLRKPIFLIDRLIAFVTVYAPLAAGMDDCA